MNEYEGHPAGEYPELPPELIKPRITFIDKIFKYLLER